MDLVCAEASVLKFCLEGEASLGMKYADEIYPGRYFIYYYIEELIMRIDQR